MDNDFDNITLLKPELSSLKQIANGKSVQMSDDTKNNLLNLGLIQPNYVGWQNTNFNSPYVVNMPMPVFDGSFVVSDKGKRYLRFHLKEVWRFRIPVIISIAAVAISIIALLKP